MCTKFCVNLAKNYQLMCKCLGKKHELYTDVLDQGQLNIHWQWQTCKETHQLHNARHFCQNSTACTMRINTKLFMTFLMRWELVMGYPSELLNWACIKVAAKFVLKIMTVHQKQQHVGTCKEILQATFLLQGYNRWRELVLWLQPKAKPKTVLSV